MRKYKVWILSDTDYSESQIVNADGVVITPPEDGRTLIFYSGDKENVVAAFKEWTYFVVQEETEK